MATLILVLALVTIGLTSSDALARTSRVFQGSVGPIAGPGSTRAVAVDQSNGDVYVVQGGGSAVKSDKVVRFDSAGAPKNFTAGPDAGTNTLTGIDRAGDIAIDNSGGPLNGTIYVIEANDPDRKILIFSTNGESRGAITGAGIPAGFSAPPGILYDPRGIAVDQSDGSVYFYNRPFAPETEIWRYTPNAPGGLINDGDYTVTGVRSTSVEHLAVGEGIVYLIDATSAVQTLPTSAFASNVPQVAPAPLESEGAPLRAKSLTLDPGNGDLYAAGSHRVSVFDPTGTLLYKFGASAYFGEQAPGIAVKSSETGAATKVYVADSKENVSVFGPVTQAVVPTHPQIAAFGSDGSPGSTFGAHALASLAFDHTARSLYVQDSSVPGIYGFDVSNPPTYSPLAPFAPLSTAGVTEGSGFAVDNTSLATAGNIYFTSTDDKLYGVSSTGVPLGGFPVDPTLSPGPPQGSPANPLGVAVDSEGNVWVANSATKRMLKYSSSGSFLGSVDTSGQGEPSSITFDSNDDMYVGFNGGRGVWKYASPAYALPTQIVSRPEIVNALAIDPSSHHIYLAQGSRIDEYDSAGSFLDEFAVDTQSGRILGLVVDPANGYLYASDRENRQVRVFSPGAVLPDIALRPVSDLADTTAVANGSVGPQTVAVSDCHFEYVEESSFRFTGFSDLSSGGSVPCGSIPPPDLNDHPVSASLSGLNPNTTYHLRLSAANANGTVVSPAQTFTTLGPPLAETTGSPVRSAGTAELLGRVDPSNSPTSFHFEYGTEGPCDTNSCDSTEPVSAGSGGVYGLAAARVSGLQPETTYHYRLVADNGAPGSPVFGEDMTVTTRASDAPLTHGHFLGPPDSDRAFEQVSLPDTGGNPVNAGQAFSDNGSRALYITSGGNPSSPTGGFLSEFLAERTESAPHTGSWKNIAVMPSREELVGSNFLLPSGPSDLSSFSIANFAVAATQRNLWRLSPSAPAQKIFEPTPPQEYREWYVGSDDSTRVVARLRGGTLDPAYPSATALDNLYDISSGTPKLASLLPGNAVSTCPVDGLEETEGLNPRNWISADGKLLFFHSCSNLYMREFETEQTKLLSGPPLSGPQCFGVLARSTADAAFFWTQTRLAADDTNPTACGGGDADGDIYRYNIADGALKCVTCLVPGLDTDVFSGFGSGTGPAETRSFPERIAVANNGSRIYFRSPHRLTTGAPSSGGIYRVNVADGGLRWIAADGVIGDAPTSGRTISSDGSIIVFRSQDPGLDPAGEGSDNGGTFQYYRYDDRDRSLVCVSCPPDGSAAERSVPLGMLSTSPEVGANATPLADDGTFAFRTTEARVGADQNTTGVGQDPVSGTDLYEWRDGKLLLITDGLTDWPSSEPPILNGVAPGGRDIFFTAATQYTQDALDAYNRLYDARIGGGFEFPPPPKPCPLEVCQGTPKGAPEEQPSGTANFAGPGNIATGTPARKAHKKKAHKKKSHKSHKKAHQKKRHNRANENRRTAR
jgi:hypothetical protein